MRSLIPICYFYTFYGLNSQLIKYLIVMNFNINVSLSRILQGGIERIDKVLNQELIKTQILCD